jgi:hypothetical protein
MDHFSFQYFLAKLPMYDSRKYSEGLRTDAPTTRGTAKGRMVDVCFRAEEMGECSLNLSAKDAYSIQCPHARFKHAL